MAVVNNPDLNEAPKPIGLSEHLSEIAGKIENISKMEKREKIRKEYYSYIKDLLNDDLSNLKKMKISLPVDNKIPEEVRKICANLEDDFVEAFNTNIEAVNLLISFMETEEPELLESANEAIEEGASLLEQAEQELV